MNFTAGFLPHVWRGEHGPKSLLTRHASWSFTDDRKAAEHYAREPNVACDRDNERRPTLIEAQLTLTRPWVNSPDDPFVDFITLVKDLGADIAFGEFLRHEKEVQNTNAWEEVAEQGYVSLTDVKARAPALLDTLCVQIYPLLDCKKNVGELRSAGFDGAIHMGSGETMNAIEYRVFDRSQIKVMAITPLDANTLAPQERPRHRRAAHH
jgi:hypothetical protein